jgi:hypothetical protein
MESDTPSGRLPNAYNWPLPWPVKLNEFLLKHTSSRRLMLNQCERIPSESSGDEMHAGTTVTGGATNVGGASIDVENGRRTVSSTTPLHPVRPHRYLVYNLTTLHSIGRHVVRTNTTQMKYSTADDLMQCFHTFRTTVCASISTVL